MDKASTCLSSAFPSGRREALQCSKPETNVLSLGWLILGFLLEGSRQGSCNALQARLGPCAQPLLLPHKLQTFVTAELCSAAPS